MQGDGTVKGVEIPSRHLHMLVVTGPTPLLKVPVQVAAPTPRSSPNYKLLSKVEALNFNNDCRQREDDFDALFFILGY